MRTRRAVMLFILALAVAVSPSRSADLYRADWDSLKTHADPRWFDDAKFGIYFHWGVYSVPAFGNEWYSRNMYRPGTKENKHHLATWGPLDRFGYKDFIPMFRGEKFDPDGWAELFEKAGAKFAGPVAEHADGFAMWDSRLTQWSAVRMGPHRDVVGDMAKAIRKRNLKFITTFHHEWLWAWYPTFNKSVDASNPADSGLYGPPVSEAAWRYQKDQLQTSPEFSRMWMDKVKEVIDKYQPDLIWFDSRVGYIEERRRTELLAYYYNQSVAWGREVGVTYKGHDLQAGSAMVDLERGRMAGLTPYKWLNDDSIDWKSWGYVEDANYKSANRLVDELIDIVSKNGNLLLNINPRADGTIPEPVRERLLEMGRWLRLNGEAIYGTRPWVVFGEGPTQVKEGHFGEKAIPDFTAQDVRFTRRGPVLYAIVLDWPAGPLTIHSLAKGKTAQLGRIREIRLLGSDRPVRWSQGETGLTLTMPATKPCDYAYVFRITSRGRQ